MIEQADGHSCGVFTVMAAEAILNEETVGILRSCHTQFYRKHIQQKILQRAHLHDNQQCDEGSNFNQEDATDVVCTQRQYSYDTDASQKMANYRYDTLQTDIDISSGLEESANMCTLEPEKSLPDRPMESDDDFENDTTLEIDDVIIEHSSPIDMNASNEVEDPPSLEDERATEVEINDPPCFQLHQEDKHKMACLLLICLAGGRLNEKTLNKNTTTGRRYWWNLRRRRCISETDESKWLKWALNAFDIPNEENIEQNLKTHCLDMKTCCIHFEKGCFTLKNQSICKHLKSVMQDKLGDLIIKMDREFLYRYVTPKGKDKGIYTQTVYFKLEVGEDMQDTIINRFATLIEERKFAFVCNHLLCSVQSFVDKLWDQLPKKKPLKRLLSRGDTEYDYSFLFWSSIADKSPLLRTAIKNIAFSKRCKSEALFGCCLSTSPLNFDLLISISSLPTACLTLSNSSFDVLRTLSALSTYHKYSQLQNKYSLLELACLGGWSSVVERLLAEDICQLFIHKNPLTCLHYACMGKTDYHGQVVKILLELQPLWIHSIGLGGQTPLHCACKAGNVNTVILLLNIGAEDKDNKDTTHVHNTSLEGHKRGVVDKQSKYGKAVCQRSSHKGQKDVITSILKDKAQVDVKNKNGDTPLHEAANLGHRNITELLLQTKVNVEKKNKYGDTSLHEAASQGHSEVAVLLLQYKANVDEKNESGETPLHLAVSEEVAELLLQYKANVDEKDESGKTPLHLAVSEGRKEVAELLLQYKANVDEKNESGETPLHLAVSEEVAELLLQYKANVDEKDKSGETPLHKAALWERKEVAVLLLQYKANVDEKNENGETPLHKAALWGGKEVAELLLQYKANVEEKDKSGKTPLHLAVSEGRKEVAELLLQYKANVEEKDKSGKTPLHLAVSEEVAELLLQYKANVDEKNKRGETPLHLAIKSWYLTENKVKLLLQYKANVDERDVKGCTPLHKAISGGHMKIAELLVSHGACKTIKNCAGETPLHIAQKRGYNNLVGILSIDVVPINNKGITRSNSGMNIPSIQSLPTWTQQPTQQDNDVHASSFPVYPRDFYGLPHSPQTRAHGTVSAQQSLAQTVTSTCNQYISMLGSTGLDVVATRAETQPLHVGSHPLLVSTMSPQARSPVCQPATPSIMGDMDPYVQIPQTRLSPSSSNIKSHDADDGYIDRSQHIYIPTVSRSNHDSSQAWNRSRGSFMNEPLQDGNPVHSVGHPNKTFTYLQAYSEDSVSNLSLTDDRTTPPEVPSSVTCPGPSNHTYTDLQPAGRDPISTRQGDNTILAPSNLQAQPLNLQYR